MRTEIYRNSRWAACGETKFTVGFSCCFFQQLLQQLALQRAVHEQQLQLRQTAQQLINEAYQQQQENSRAKRQLDNQHVKALLDEAFPLSKQQQPRRASSNPISLPSEAASRAMSDSRAGTSTGAKPSTAFDKLLADGTLTAGLPPQPTRKTSSPVPGGRKSAQSVDRRPAQQTTSNMRAWEPVSPRDVPSDPRARSAAEMISRGLENLTPEEKNALLQAIRNEMQAMQPPSSERK